MRRFAISATAVLVACASEKKPEPSAAPEPESAAAEPQPAAQDAKQQAIDNARKAGVLGLLENEGEARPVGPADAWWNAATPCRPPATLRTEDRGAFRDFACVGPDGVKDGRSATWNTMSDQLFSENNHRAGKLDGVQLTYVGGKKLVEETYRDGVQDGPYVVYTTVGAVGMRGQYKAGKKDGLWTELDATGAVKATMPYRAGTEHGTWTGSDRGDTWRIDFAGGAIQKVSVVRNGAAVAAADLAGDELCNRMVARMREAGGSDKPDPDGERYLYISCRARLTREVECFIAAEDVTEAKRCLAPPAPGRK